MDIPTDQFGSKLPIPGQNIVARSRFLTEIDEISLKDIPELKDAWMYAGDGEPVYELPKRKLRAKLTLLSIGIFI
jgi:hypothetical protein